jgi:hypothetical protein
MDEQRARFPSVGSLSQCAKRDSPGRLQGSLPHAWESNTLGSRTFAPTGECRNHARLSRKSWSSGGFLTIW